MVSVTHNVRFQSKGSPTRLAIYDLLRLGLPLVLMFTAVTKWRFDLPLAYLLHAIVLYVIMAGLILRNIPTEFPSPGLGIANRITLIRASLVLPVVPLLFQPGILNDVGYWWVIIMSLIAMVCDGIDGWIARRSGTSTVFGGRFDMELDALLILALSTLVALSEKVGTWVLFIGAMRYLFVIAGWIWPRLQGALPHSQRRKTVCVLQGIALVIGLAPLTSTPVATTDTGGTLAMLFDSFAIDTKWLIAEAPR